MFSIEFYPTPPEVIAQMCEGLNLEGRTILEPSAGSGNIVEYCQKRGASVIACEKDKDLQKIIAAKCLLIGEDFLSLTSDKVSHIDYVIMNPPFSNAARHILHAFEIAPAGCRVIALCNYQTIDNTCTRSRSELRALIDNYGNAQNLGDCFSNADRKTDVEVGMIILNKPGAGYENDFEGFFMEEELEHSGSDGLMEYNFVRDIVNRYISAVKVHDEVLTANYKLRSITAPFFKGKINVGITSEQFAADRNKYKKELQKDAWQYILDKMNLKKYATSQLKEDINAFVEKQHQVPFTMKNIYNMLEIVIGTTGARMDKAILEVFEKLTKHHDENRYNVEGWKTNSHFLVNKRFIFPYMVEADFSGKMRTTYYSAFEKIEDMEKVLCWLTGVDYYETTPLRTVIDNDRGEFGKWHDAHHFFRVRGYKKGTMHFEFKSEDVWAMFNRKVAELKGYPLFEHKERSKDYNTEKKQRQTTRAETLFEIQF